MPERNWLLHPPIGAGLIIVLMLVGAGLAAQKRNSQSGDEAPSKELRNVDHVLTIGAAPAVKTPHAEPDAKRDEWREEQDLIAQKQMADWSWLAMVAAWFSAVATAIGIYLLRETLRATRDTLREAKDATRTARNIGEAQVKAYLTFEPTSLELIAMNGTSGVPQLHFTLTNSGNSPATDISIQARCTDSHDLKVAPEGPTCGHIFDSLQAGGRIRQYLHFGKVLADAANDGEYMGVRVILQLQYRDVFNNVTRYDKTYMASGKPQNGVASFRVHEWDVDWQAVTDPWETKTSSET